MNCSIHGDAAAVAFCRACGKGLCAECRREAGGAVYCAEHAPDRGAPAPSGGAYGGGAYTSAPYAAGPLPPVHNHPPLAFGLGFIPGVGAIYNGQYGKGLMHAIIFGLFVSILSSNETHGLEPLIGILLAVFVLYMAFEAYHTARRRSLGEPVDEFSSLFQSRQGHSAGSVITLIVVGAVFLLNTLDIIERHQILRFWPVLLIALGVSMLHSRMSGGGGADRGASDPNREVNHERQ